VAAEALCRLYAAFPVRSLLLVEDLSGPIHWDITGLPDRRSQGCFETLIWLGEHDLLRYRSVEPRDIGIEGAVLSQRGFVLLSAQLLWDTGESNSRIAALREARRERSYGDMGTVIQDLLAANCRWSAPREQRPLVRAARMQVEE
jgi:hypothetical protein